MAITKGNHPPKIDSPNCAAIYETAQRKDTPVYSGFMCYFPDAIREVSRLSKAGNEQHNPGSELHWDRSKSGDELDALGRHLLDGTDKTQTLDARILHARAVAWRGMADLQKLCELREESPEVLVDLDNRHPQGRGVAVEGPLYSDGPDFPGYETRVEKSDSQ